MMMMLRVSNIYGDRAAPCGRKVTKKKKQI